jgi:orotate phosphoribosyltransferase
MEEARRADRIAAILLDCGAVELRPDKPFTWASGWLAPIYCDNRLTLSFPEVRKEITKELALAARSFYTAAGAVAGVATAGIPQGSLLADALNLPFLYIRPKPKEHGKQNQVEGRIVPNQPTIVVEDLVSTGGSSIAAAKALQAEGGRVAGMLAIFTYGFEQAEEAFREEKLKLVTLSNYEALIRVAKDKGAVTSEQLESLSLWRRGPSVWGR